MGRYRPTEATSGFLRTLAESSKSKVTQEIEKLSDTLLASKFGVSRYEEIDAVRERLLVWTKANFDSEWVNWMDALEAYKAKDALEAEEETPESGEKEDA